MRKSLAAVVLTAVIIFALQFLPDLLIPQPAVVICSPVQAMAIYTSVNAEGRIEENEKKLIYPDSSAKLTKLYASVGDFVKKGTILAEYEPIAGSEASTGGSVSTEDLLNNLPDSPEVAMVFSYLESAGLLGQLQGQTGSGQDRTVGQDGLLLAPFDGIITELSAGDGSLIGTAASVMAVSDVSRMTVKASIGEDLIGSIQVGQRVYITGDGFKNQQYSGVVTQIYPTARQLVTTSYTETVVDVVIKIEKPDDNLRPGYTADVKIITSSRDRAMVIPYEAVRQDNNQQEYVMVYRDGWVYRRNIVSGAELEDVLEIKSGLREGETVILDPDPSLKHGSRATMKGE